MWFTNWNTNTIGRITPAGTVTNFIGPDVDLPLGIAAGPDGNMWFTNLGGRTSIGRITTGGVITTFNTPSIYSGAIAAGPDGNMWFATNATGYGSIERITPAGVTANFTATTSLTGGDRRGSRREHVVHRYLP